MKTTSVTTRGPADKRSGRRSALRFLSTCPRLKMSPLMEHWAVAPPFARAWSRTSAVLVSTLAAAALLVACQQSPATTLDPTTEAKVVATSTASAVARVLANASHGPFSRLDITSVGRSGQQIIVSVSTDLPDTASLLVTLEAVDRQPRPPRPLRAQATVMVEGGGSMRRSGRLLTPS